MRQGKPPVPSRLTTPDPQADTSVAPPFLLRSTSHRLSEEERRSDGGATAEGGGADGGTAPQGKGMVRRNSIHAVPAKSGCLRLCPAPDWRKMDMPSRNDRLESQIAYLET